MPLHDRAISSNCLQYNLVNLYSDLWLDIGDSLWIHKSIAEYGITSFIGKYGWPSNQRHEKWLSRSRDCIECYIWAEWVRSYRAYCWWHSSRIVEWNRSYPGPIRNWSTRQNFSHRSHFIRQNKFLRLQSSLRVLGIYRWIRSNWFKQLNWQLISYGSKTQARLRRVRRRFWELWLVV